MMIIKPADILKQLFKIGLFGILFFLVYHFFLSDKIDWPAVKQSFRHADLFLLSVALGFMAIRFLILGFKFQLSAQFLNAGSKSGFLLNEFKLLFLEFILPVPNAEDAFRLLFLKMKEISFSKSISAILAMRISGMITLAFLLAGFFFYTGTSIVHYNRDYMLLLIGLILILLFTHRLWIKLIAGYVKRPVWLNNLLHKMLLDNLSYKNYITLILLTLLHYFATAVTIYFLLLAFGGELSILILLLIVPILVLSFFIPLSVQGLGLPEAALLFILLRLNVSSEIASAVSITHLLLYICLILLGGILFFFDKQYRLESIKQEIRSIKALRKKAI